MLSGNSLKKTTWRASWLLPSEKRRQQAQSLAVAPGMGLGSHGPRSQSPPRWQGELQDGGHPHLAQLLLSFSRLTGIFLCGRRHLSHLWIRVPGTVRREKTQGWCYHSETCNLLEGIPKSNIIFMMGSFWHLSEALKVTKLICVVVISIYTNFFLWLKRQKDSFMILKDKGNLSSAQMLI